MRMVLRKGEKYCRNIDIKGLKETEGRRLESLVMFCCLTAYNILVNRLDTKLNKDEIQNRNET